MSKESALENLSKSLSNTHLPAMSQSALSVLKLENDLAKVNINDVVRPIEADPGLAAQVLKFLNSSAFGFTAKISNLRQGVALVGIRIIKNFVLWKAVFSLIPKSKTGTFDVALLWQDSLRRAMFARFILLETKKGDPEMAFAGALLQDMAIPILLKWNPTEYGQVLDSLKSNTNKRLSELEEEYFDWNHADVCRFLGKQWQLPNILVELITKHLDISNIETTFSQHPELAAVVISALLPSVVQEEWVDKEAFIKAFDACFSDTHLRFPVLFDRVDREFDQYAALLHITPPNQSLFTHIEE